MSYYTFYKLILKPQWNNPDMSHDIRETIREALRGKEEVMQDEIKGEYYIAVLSNRQELRLHMKEVAKLLA